MGLLALMLLTKVVVLLSVYVAPLVEASVLYFSCSRSIAGASLIDGPLD